MGDQPDPPVDEPSRKRDCSEETLTAVGDPIKKRRGGSRRSTRSNNNKKKSSPVTKPSQTTPTSAVRVEPPSEDATNSTSLRPISEEPKKEATTLDAVTDTPEQPDMEQALLRVVQLSSSEPMAREYLNDREWVTFRMAKSDDRAELSSYFKNEMPSFVENLMAALDCQGTTFALLGYMCSEDHAELLSAVAILSLSLKNFERAIFVECLKSNTDLLRRRLWLRLSLLQKYTNCKHILTTKKTLEATGDDADDDEKADTQ